MPDKETHAAASKSKGKSASGARKQNNPSLLNSYFNNHSKVAKSTLGQLAARPIASFFTCSVIGITLVLPALLAILLGNIKAASVGWEGEAQMTLFLQKGMPELDAGVLANDLAKRANVKQSKLVTNEDALASLKDMFTLNDGLAYLDENPLPHTIVLTPSENMQSIDKVNMLKSQFEALPEVVHVQVDVLWIQRLQSITVFVESAIWIVAIMLGIAVLLIVGNTIRLSIENRKEEIIVLKLVGGTTPFVCRPFLYTGALLGLGGSLLAVILIQITVTILNGPIESLAMSYQSTFSLSGLGFESTLFLLVVGMALGWLGAWFAVNKHLDDIEPT